MIKMECFWMWSFAIIFAGLASGVQAHGNEAARNVVDNIDDLVAQLGNQRGVTFRGNEDVLKAAAPLYQFGQAYDLYEQLAQLNNGMIDLDVQRVELTRQLEKQIDSLLQLVYPSLCDLRRTVSDILPQLYLLFYERISMQELKKVKSKLTPFTNDQQDRLTLLEALSQNVEALREQGAYDELRNACNVEHFLEEYEAAMKLVQCKEYLTKAISSMDNDNCEISSNCTNLTCECRWKTTQLRELRKILRGEFGADYGNCVLEQIRKLPYLGDFAEEELDRYSGDDEILNSLYVIKTLQKQRKEKCLIEVVAIILTRLVQLRNETCPQPVLVNIQA